MIRKFSKPFLFVLLFTATTLFSKAQDPQKEAFAKKLAAILQTKNEPAYLKLFPDYPKMVVILKEIFAVSGQQMDSSFMSLFTEDKYQQEMVNELGGKFRKFMEKGEEKGIAWDNTSLLSYTMELKQNEDDGQAVSDKMKMYGGELELKSGDKTFIVKFNETLWWGDDQQFYGADLRKVFEKGKEEPDEEWGELTGVDTAMAILDTTIAVDEPAPPPPPKKKATVPAKPKTTPKPKTAARKPKS